MSVIANIKIPAGINPTDEDWLAQAIVLTKSNLAWLRSDALSMDSMAHELKSARDKLIQAFPVALRKISGQCTFLTEKEIQLLNSFQFNVQHHELKII